MKQEKEHSFWKKV